MAKNYKFSGAYDEIPEKIKEAICYYLATYPTLSIKHIGDKVERALLGIRPGDSLIEQVKDKEEERIDELALGGVEAVRLGCKLRELPYATLLGRVKLLHDLIHLGKEGYFEQTVSPHGEVLEIKKYNFRTALDAVKQLTLLMERVEEVEEDDIDTITVDTYDFFKTS